MKMRALGDVAEKDRCTNSISLPRLFSSRIELQRSSMMTEYRRVTSPLFGKLPFRSDTFCENGMWRQF
jgi:hypothetical protein